ncbi:MAG: hypothetical protein KA054_03205 [Candidatus Moranbacteria bacterium]|nr:hypothetical protein [Candidatus Moranbacteria bacterium]
MKKDDIGKMLFNQQTGIADSDYFKYLFEQYKLYIESAERISDRRQKANEFFLALNTAILSVTGFLIGRGGDLIPPFFYILIGLGGVVICYFWYRIVRSYKGLNSGKFDVIHAVETKLPLSLYDSEWEILGRGNDRSKYWPFSHIELNIPWIFIVFHSFIFLKFFIPVLIIIYPILMGPVK